MGEMGTELSAFMAEQLIDQLKQNDKLRAEAVEAKMQAVRAEAKVQVAEAKAEAKVHLAEAKALAKAATAKVERAGNDARLRDQQLAALVSRLEAMLASKLLEEEEMFAIEDILADCAPEDDRVTALIDLSSKMTAERAFARQLRRKYVAQ